jgi:hypothetical protein
MANSRAVETPPDSGIEGNHNVGSVHNRFAAGRKPARDFHRLLLEQVGARKPKKPRKRRNYNDLRETLINRKNLLECSKNAKKSDDKAQSLS